MECGSRFCQPASSFTALPGSSTAVSISSLVARLGRAIRVARHNVTVGAIGSAGIVNCIREFDLAFISDQRPFVIEASVSRVWLAGDGNAAGLMQICRRPPSLTLHATTSRQTCARRGMRLSGRSCRIGTPGPRFAPVGELVDALNPCDRAEPAPCAERQLLEGDGSGGGARRRHRRSRLSCQARSRKLSRDSSSCSVQP